MYANITYNTYNKYNYIIIYKHICISIYINIHILIYFISFWKGKNKKQNLEECPEEVLIFYVFFLFYVHSASFIGKISFSLSHNEIFLVFFLEEMR